ncbi:hypothetical protein FB567DRAFT_83023 [Paraphoma chrysanthemicola]|uniref:Uncharacterized protein n=1 Tax=Paraphoma chrysanthemicola TaxID=798071 RepID=A0A8K0R4Y7_9PLEO|nr:hypothetical protein FB567DRAFT_83023 [Paraphoma chrysanthemicola]
MRIFKLVPLVLAALPLALAGKKDTLTVYGAPISTDENAGPGSCAPSSPEHRRCVGQKLQWCKPTGWATVQECAADQECVVGKDIKMGGECRARSPPKDLPIDRTTGEFRLSKHPIQTSEAHVVTSVVLVTSVVTVTASVNVTSTVTASQVSSSTGHKLTSLSRSIPFFTLRPSLNVTSTTLASVVTSSANHNLTTSTHLVSNSTMSAPIPSSSSTPEDPERCKANSHRCFNNNIQDCVLREHWATREACKSGTICEENCDLRGNCNPYCKTPTPPSDDNRNKCPVSATRCNANKIQTCNDDKAWIDKETCATGTICTENCSRSGCVPFCRSKSNPNARFPECEPGLQKCDVTFTRLFLCNKDRAWNTDIICDTDSTCVNDAPGKAHCEKQDKTYTPPPNLARNLYQICKPGELSCSEDGYRLIVCNEDGQWETKKKCATPGDCKIDSPGVAHCQRGGIDPPKFKRQEHALCTPGELSCSEDGYRLIICNNSQWETKKKCATPGDCKIDGPGTAHCQRGDIDPPKLTRDESVAECSPKDKACDTERRFLFTCQGNSTWNAGAQCFGPGWCAVDWTGLTCTGFPRYVGPGATCNGECEFNYLYCLGASDHIPAVKQQCFNAMCNSEEVSEEKLDMG